MLLLSSASHRKQSSTLLKQSEENTIISALNKGLSLHKCDVIIIANVCTCTVIKSELVITYKNTFKNIVCIYVLSNIFILSPYHSRLHAYNVVTVVINGRL